MLYHVLNVFRSYYLKIVWQILDIFQLASWVLVGTEENNNKIQIQLESESSRRKQIAST